MALERSSARKEARGGSPGRFRIRSTFLGEHVSWGSCETREEAFAEAARILDGFPETSAVLVEEVIRYEFGPGRARPGSAGFFRDPRGSAPAGADSGLMEAA